MLSQYQKTSLYSEQAPDKSNEIESIPILLKGMAINAASISIHAMGIQRGVANLIKLKKVDNFLALKSNHLRFYRKLHSFLNKLFNV